MYIKKNDMLRRSASGYYYTLHKVFQLNISYITLFFHDAHVYAQREGITNFINDLYTPDPDGDCEMMFEMVSITADLEYDLVFMHEDISEHYKKANTPALKFLYGETPVPQLCREKKIDCAVMSKQNFEHLLTKWDQLWYQNPPFILLYQDDQEWYEFLPFESQEEMEKFVADHTEPQLK